MPDIRETITQLKQPFPISAHKERQLPGGGRWFFIPWQAIRDRLDEVCPEWQVSYSEPGYLGDYCHISCTITIAGISRSAPGNAPIQLLSSSGKDMSRGTPIERAIADAFKNAAEAWGVARYLDDQEYVVKYMQGKGDMRGYKFWHENQQIEAGARGQSKKSTEPASNQRSGRLWASATLNTQSKYPQSDRVKAICSLLNYPQELAREWLSSQGKKQFDELTPDAIDYYVGEVCKIWAIQNGMNEFHAKNSYKKRVLGDVMDGLPELEAIRKWMDYVVNLGEASGKESSSPEISHKKEMKSV